MTDLQSIRNAGHTLVMGVLNITEDSFSDGGLWLEPGKAAEHGRAMLAAGADIIDIGAESTRPGAKRVSEEDELARVCGAVGALIGQGAVLSIDTTRACHGSSPTTIACTSCSIGVDGWPARTAPHRTPTPRTTSMACSPT